MFFFFSWAGGNHDKGFSINADKARSINVALPCFERLKTYQLNSLK